jgi:hypothetical protein
MHHGASPQTTLHGPQLFAARLAWITATVLVVGVYAAAVPVAFAAYRDVCEFGATCGPYWYLTSRDAMALRGMGALGRLLRCLQHRS